MLWAENNKYEAMSNTLEFGYTYLLLTILIQFLKIILFEDI